MGKGLVRGDSTLRMRQSRGSICVTESHQQRARFDAFATVSLL